MSVAFNGSSQYLVRTSNLPAMATFSALAWCVPSSDPAWSSVLSFGNTSGGATPHVLIGNSSNNAWSVWNGSNQGAFATDQNSGAVVCVAMTNNGTTLQGYSRSVSQNSWETASVAGVTGTPNSFRVGNSVYDGTDYFAGRVWGVKVWDRVLTSDELLVESFFARVMFPSSLVWHWPLRSVSDLNDYSGNGRSATAVGSPTTGDSAWQPWKRGAHIYVPTAAVAGVSLVQIEHAVMRGANRGMLRGAR